MLILLAIVLCVGANGFQWTPSEIPDPVKNFSLCGRFAPSHICNPDGIISNDTANWFDSDLVAGKLQIGTLWIGNVTALPMADFSSMVFNEWGIGDPVLNDGVLLVVAVGNRTIYIRVGAGVVSKFTDSVISGIITSMKDQVSHGYDQMLRTGTEAILTTLGGTSIGRSSSSSGSGGGAKNSGPSFDIKLFLIVVFSIIGVSILCVVIVAFMSNVSKNRERENYHTRVSAPVAPVASVVADNSIGSDVKSSDDFFGSNVKSSDDFFGSDVKSSDDFFGSVSISARATHIVHKKSSSKSRERSERPSHKKSSSKTRKGSHKKSSSKSRNSTSANNKQTPQRKYRESSDDRAAGYNYGGGGYGYGGGGEGGGDDYGGGGGGGAADYGGGNDTGGGGGGGGWD